jgi:Zn ribbon nucleic-acid-binding protein
MKTTKSNRRTVFGMNCVQCGDLLIAPEWSEYEDDQHLVNLWSCSNCGCHFQTEALVTTSGRSANDDAVIKGFFPSLLVA